MCFLRSMFKHQTSTFSPLPSPFEFFFSGSSDVLCSDWYGKSSRYLPEQWGPVLMYFFALEIFDPEQDRCIRHRCSVEALPVEG